MKKIMLFLILLVLFVSVSAVSAEGNFTSLQNEIDTSDDGIELQQDYVYDNGTDINFKEGIFINKTDFVINGNGHTIDGASQARIFYIAANNVTILNLNILNGNSLRGSAICINGVTDISVKNSYFENNSAEFGASIFSFQVTGTINIINSTFVNSNAKYASALYAEAVEDVNIQNSTFRNLSAEESGGAIGIAVVGTVEINNSTFINTKSVKNGGAVYLDTMKESGGTPYVEITKSRFYNSTGDYGGALTILSGGVITSSGPEKIRTLYFGDLNLSDCEFKDNTALYNGGAVYLSGLNANIKNTSFYRNTPYMILEGGYSGGGLYIDFSNATVENCRFINNSMQAIYAYDTQLNVTDTLFADNGNAIHAVFSDCNLKNLTVENDTVILNETYYAGVVHEIAKDIILIGNTLNVVTLPSRYDSRDWGWVSSVKDQGRMGACWAFGTCGALESALLKATGIEYDLSENNMQNSMLQFSKSGIIGETEGGVDAQGTEYVLSWLGVMPSEYDSYDESGKLSPLIIADNEKIHIVDAIFVDPRKNATDNDAVKNAILRCGAVVTAYASDGPDEAYNSKTAAYYQNFDNTTCHEICFVGWDDNFPASNFNITPPGDGAFIVKNSWGTNWGENGFFYISYYDTSVLNTSIAIGFIIENTDNYTTNYQTDLSGYMGIISNKSNVLSYKNTYTAEYGPELISAVGTYFDADENYTLEIYINDRLVHTQNGTSPFNGYHTVKLTEEIPIITGDKFTALMKKAMAVTFSQSRQHYRENISLINSGEGWMDLAAENKTLSLKVYTKDLAIYTKDLVKIYKNDSKFEANVGEANETVTFEINGVSYNRVSDENGTARMAINLNPGNYTIKTTYNNVTVENTIEVLPTLIAKNLIKYFQNESQFYISLIDGEGRPVASKNITMNINGVFYNRETNENGTARLSINLNPNTYILTAADPLTGLQMSYNITVLPVLNAEDLKMTYRDGSTFNVTLVDGQGKALENAEVTFNVNGVFYKRYTDSNGIAKLNINLISGEYIITAQYGEAMISNRITISANEEH